MSELTTTIISQHYYFADFDTNELAHKLEVSPELLRKRCKRHYGKTPSAMIDIKRLKMTITMIAMGVNLREVFKVVGYKNSRALRYAMKKRLNYSPEEVRELIMRNGAEYEDILIDLIDH